MGKPIASSILSFSILPAMLLSLAGPVSAQEDDVEALKAKIAALQGTVDNTMQGREYLFNELTAANKRADAAEASLSQLQNQSSEMDDLKKQLEQATIGRDYLAERLEREVAESAAIVQTMEKRLEVADNGQNYMTDRFSQMLDEKTANEASLKQQLEKVTVGRDYLAERLKTTLEEKLATEAELGKATYGRDFLSGRAKDALAASASKDKELARVKKSLTMAKRGRSYLKEQTLALTAESEKKDAEIARLKKSLTMAKRGRSYLKEQTLALTAESEKKEAELDRMAEVAFVQINSAIAERDAAREATMTAAADADGAKSTDNSWATARSVELSGSFAGLAEVSATDDNRVSIEVGNSGLFKSGGTILTENGESVLLQLGDVLAEMKDTHINVAGHTDNRPVGSGGRFASNAELSFARAASALRFLNRNAGISADNLSASGLGDRYPIASNDTAEGRTANRRVEILLSEK